MLPRVSFKVLPLKVATCCDRRVERPEKNGPSANGGGSGRSRCRVG